MTSSGFLEVIIGLVFIYLLCSLICSALNEIVSQIFKLRARNLENALDRILTDEKTRNEFYKHPLIQALGKKPKNGQSLKISYMPPKTFSLALLDSLSKSINNMEQPSADKQEKDTPLISIFSDFSSARNIINKIENEDMKVALKAIFDSSSKNLDLVRKSIETWFDDVMDRAAGWYKRKSQGIILIIAFILTAGMNVDTTHITKSLWQNPIMRQGLVTAAEGYIAEAKSPEEIDKSISDLQKRIERLDLPIGWYGDLLPNNFLGWISKVIGILLTTIAISLGAPFWFDILNKFMKIRGTGPIPEKTKT